VSDIVVKLESVGDHLGALYQIDHSAGHRGEEKKG